MIRMLMLIMIFSHPRLALMPRQVVSDLLNISIETIETFNKEKQYIIA